MRQLDIFGRESESLAWIEAPKPRDASVQERLFEPQMEGQLALETDRPAQGGPVQATTPQIIRQKG